jgi:hypothetical protein
MRKITRAFTGLAAAASAVGMAGPALAANQARPLERVPAHAASSNAPAPAYLYLSASE